MGPLVWETLTRSSSWPNGTEMMSVFSLTPDPQLIANSIPRTGLATFFESAVEEDFPKSISSSCLVVHTANALRFWVPNRMPPPLDRILMKSGADHLIRVGWGEGRRLMSTPSPERAVTPHALVEVL